jgi:chromosome partitioning protein
MNSHKSIAFFNNKGGVGKTSLAYHVAWMMSQRGMRVLVADLDPQANLSTMFFDEDHWLQYQNATVFTPILPILEGSGSIGVPFVHQVGDNIGVLIGDLKLSMLEEELSQQWPKCLSADKRALRVVSAFHTVLQSAAVQHRADVVLVDVGPNLGSLNRSALLAVDHVITPLAVDLFSLLGLQNTGPQLKRWRKDWQARRARADEDAAEIVADLPAGHIGMLGYVCAQHAFRASRPVKSYESFLMDIPITYRRDVLGLAGTPPPIDDDENCLAQIPHYRSLMALAQQHRKPIFQLTAADGAMGAHHTAARRCADDFGKLTDTICARAGIAPTLE